MTNTTRAQKWNAETSAHPFAKNDRWAIVFDPTPGGIDNGDGTRTFSLRFPALFLSEYVDDPEQAAKDIAQALNEYEPGLLARAETAERELAEAVAAALEMVAYEVAEAEEHDAAQNDWRDGEWLAKRIASGIRARTPADASSALAAVKAEAREEGRREAVKVKPLVWEDMGHYERAKTDFGDYEAGWDDGAWAVCDGPISWEWSSGEDHRGLTVYAAKAAAQADYERRIRAALTGEGE